MAEPSNGAARTSLISRTIDRCKSGLNRIGAAGSGRDRPPAPVATAAGCFPVYVGPERVRFLVRAEQASHPLFRRLLDDAEREYGHAARGGIALPCDVDAFLDVQWHMQHDGDGEIPTAVAVLSPPPIWSLRGLSRGRAAIYRMINPRSSPVVARIGKHKEATQIARTQSN